MPRLLRKRPVPAVPPPRPSDYTTKPKLESYRFGLKCYKSVALLVCIMAMQVNVRLDEADWEKIVEAMPGLSNGERLTRLVRQQLTLLDSRHDLARALELIEAELDPTLQALRRQRLLGQGSEIAEELAQSVIESAALLLAQADNLHHAPEKHLPELEAKLVRRWSRTALQLLRTAALDPAQIRHPAQTAPELRRVLEQAAFLATRGSVAAAAASSVAAHPAATELAAAAANTNSGSSASDSRPVSPTASTETTTPNRG